MTNPTTLKYTRSHEWVRREADGTVSVGITDHAQQQLGDVVYVQPPEVGRQLKQGEECGVVESVKAAADIYAPISGEVIAANAELDGSPQLVNENAWDAWMYRLRPARPEEIDALLDAQGYEQVAAEDSH